jgi:hypothetical protein
MTCEGILLLSFYEGLKQNGCPICRLLDNFERKTIDNILDELVLDPSIRQKFIESLGLCKYHAWLLVDIAKERGNRLGAAVIYESVLKEYIDNFEKILNKEEKIECFICEYTDKFQEYYIDLYTDCFKEGKIKEYAQSSSILCHRHLRMIIEKLDKENIKKLTDIQKLKLSKLYSNITKFIEKHDYKNTEPITDEEKKSIETAVEILKGYKSYYSTTLYFQKKPKRYKLFLL